MQDQALLGRLWENFARLQALLGRHAGPGRVMEREGLVASIVPGAPESPTLNAAVAIDPDMAPQHLSELAKRFDKANVNRWGVWIDGSAHDAAQALEGAGMTLSTGSPGMGATLDELHATATDGPPQPADLTTVGKVNDLAYGNHDNRLMRTLAPLPNGVLKGYRQDLDGAAAAVALALHHNDDCGVSFVATIPRARRRGLATKVMHQALTDAQSSGCTTTTLQATDVGERLYANLGYRHLCVMQLWEHRR